ncbi:unnamed protein product, partial [Porites evermanni]
AIPKSGLYTLDLRNVTGIDFTDTQKYLKNVSNEAVVVAPWKICPNTSVADADHIPVYGSKYPTAEDIINDTNRRNNCMSLKLFDIPLPRYYTKERFYRQAVQYADKADGVDKTIIVFSAPYRAHDYQSDVNESVTITASAPIIISDDNNNTVVAAGELQHLYGKCFNSQFVRENRIILFESLGCSVKIFVRSAYYVNALVMRYICKKTCDVSRNNKCSERYCRFIDDDGFVVASNVDGGSEVGKFLGALEGGGTVMRTLINTSQFEKLFNIYSLFSRSGVAMAEGQQQQDMIPCSQELQFYKGHWRQEREDTVKCQVNPGCLWRLYAAPVTGTNLRLVVESRNNSWCTCNSDTRLTTKPIDYIAVKVPTSSCRSPADHGKPPPPCALASISSPARLAMFLVLILTLFSA